MAKYYKMGTKRQKLHRAIYDRLVNGGMESGKAYNLATKLTGWA